MSPQQILSCTKNPSHCGGKGGCLGATAELAVDYVIEAGGVVQEWQWGYESYDGGEVECKYGNGTVSEGSLSGRRSEKKNKNNDNVAVDDDNSSSSSSIHVGPDPGGTASPVASVKSYVTLPQNSARSLMHALQFGPVAVSVAASGWKSYHGGVYNGSYSGADTDVNHAVVCVGYGVTSDNVGYWIIKNSWGPNWGENGYIRLRRMLPHEGDEICAVDEHVEDGTGCEGETGSVVVCGTSGVLWDSVMLKGGYLI